MLIVCLVAIFAIPIALYRAQIGPPARNGNKWPKNGFWPTGKKGKKWPKNGKIGPKMDQKWPFSDFSAIFRPFFPFFGHFFPISGRNRDRNAILQNGVCDNGVYQFLTAAFAIVLDNPPSPCIKVANTHLSGPYCAIPRDYLSDTPLLRAMGFLVFQHGQLGAIPPPPFLSAFTLGEHAKWRCDTPHQKGYLSDTSAIPYENRQNSRYPPLRYHLERVLRDMGGYLALGH